MELFSLNDQVEIGLGLTAVAAGQTAQYTSVIDTHGYEGIRFIVAMGTITSGAATSLKVQQDDANATAGMADLLGSSITIPDTASDTLFVSQYIKPGKRYLRCVVSRATQNSVINGIYYELFRAAVVPVTHGATVTTLESHISPVEGPA